MALNVDPNTYPVLVGPLYFFSIFLSAFLLFSGVVHILLPLQTLLQQAGGASSSVPESDPTDSDSAIDASLLEAIKDITITSGIQVLAIGANVLVFALLRDRRGTGVAIIVAHAHARSRRCLEVMRGEYDFFAREMVKEWIVNGLVGWLTWKLLVL
ncbi:hypothetical protein RQP46_005601 [Phenoliferia psychrophenolica]